MTKHFETCQNLRRAQDLIEVLERSSWYLRDLVKDYDLEFGQIKRDHIQMIADRLYALVETKGGNLD